MKSQTIFVLFICGLTGIPGWNIELQKKEWEIHMDDQLIIPFNLTDNLVNNPVHVNLELLSEDEDVARFNGEQKLLNMNLTVVEGRTEGTFTVDGVFLGRTRLLLTLREENGRSHELESIDVIVIRKQRFIDHAFTGSVAILVSLIYINFGCALDWSSLRPLLHRPVGPAIAFIGQFVVMPVLAYCVGLLVFADMPEMRLGMLFAGVSPAGGASNVWTCVLDGNVDLSVTMTTISTLAAFAMMPLWLFTLGPLVFADAHISVPYLHIGTLAGALVVPLFVGGVIQRMCPRVARVLARILKGFSALLIVFIVVFAIATNLYLFRLATWRIAVAGLLLPWCGYLLGAGLALLAQQPHRDVMAIAIETGVQNTGIAIFLLRFSLPPPQADLTTIVPVAIAVMTPVPLTLLYLYRRFFTNKTTDSDSSDNDLVTMR